MRSRLADYLKTTDVEATLVGCDTATPTVARAAATLGVSASAIVKSIVLEHRQEPRGACLAIVPGDCRVSRAKVATALAVGRLRSAPASVSRGFSRYMLAPQVASEGLAGLADLGDRPPQRQAAADPVVLGGVSDDDGHAGYFGGGAAAAARTQPQ